MKFDNTSPIYQQVVDEIKKQIVSGKIQPGDKLPSGREMAAIYMINPNTAARVLQLLESMGIAYTKRGMGTFVVEDTTIVETIREEMVHHYVEAYKENMKSLGYSEEEMIAYIKKGDLQ